MAKVLFLLIGITCLGFLSLFFINYPVISGQAVLSQNKTLLNLTEEQTHEQFITNLIEGIAVEVANSRDYKFGLYDCTEYSKELVKRLKEKNINAYCVYGIVTGQPYPFHTWVIVEVGNKKIPVEATGGYIIDSEEYKNYKLRGTGICL